MANKKIRTYILFAAVGIAIGAGVIGYPKVVSLIERISIERANEDVMAQILVEQVLEQTIENIKKIPEELAEAEEPVVVLENAYLKVPFVCQAPFQTEANWVFHEESCEEAALIQVHYYLEGTTNPSAQESHDTILDMIAWQEVNFGEHKDLYANDMKIFIRDYYGYPDEDIKIIYDAEIIDIKKAVSQGYPIIVPIMGDILRNPYYPYPGYHMLTIIGYTPESIITNDVGTKRGADYKYDYNTLYNAVSDWETGRKAAIVIQ